MIAEESFNNFEQTFLRICFLTQSKPSLKLHKTAAIYKLYNCKQNFCPIYPISNIGRIE